MMLSIAVIALSCQAAPAPKEVPSLKSLCEVAKRLDDGVTAFLGGKNMKEAFGTLDGGDTSEQTVKKLRDDLAKNHVTSVKTFGIEVRLVFYSDEKRVYSASAVVHATPTEAVLCGISGSKSEGGNKIGVLPDKCAKEAKAFGDTATVLVNALKSPKPMDLPFVDPEKISKLLPKFYKDGMKQKLEEAKAEAEKVRLEVGALTYDEVRVFLDEHYIIPLGDDGLPKNGMIRGKLKLTEDGDVKFRFSRYEVK